jgi:hypothetical protein
MLYYVIEFEDGTKQKISVEKIKENQIREMCERVGMKVKSITQVAIDTEDKTKRATQSFEVRLSFNEDGQNVSISKEELPKVMWAFLRDSKVVCMNGAFRGKDIISILPNFNAIMGWNKGYSPTPEDHALIQRSEVCLSARNYHSRVKDLCMESQDVQELIEKSKQLLLA